MPCSYNRAVLGLNNQIRVEGSGAVADSGKECNSEKIHLILTGTFAVSPLKWGFPKIRGTLFGGPHNKDYSILGVYIGVPLFWGTTKSCLRADP